MSYELLWRYRPSPDWLPPDEAITIDRGLWLPSDSYFPVSIGWMSKLLDLMIARSMVGFGDAPLGPEPELFGVSNPPYPGSTDFTQHPDPLLESFEEAWWPTRMTRLPEPGIALYKLSSNDHWWVRPDEINEALVRAAHWPEPDYWAWKDWIAYLRGAAAHGGFTVL